MFPEWLWGTKPLVAQTNNIEPLSTATTRPSSDLAYLRQEQLNCTTNNSTRLQVHLAGSITDRSVMRARANNLTTFCDITYRWFDDEYGSIVTLSVSAEKNIQSVRDADVIFACLDIFDYPYRGTWTEIGAAIALNKPVIIYMPQSRPLSGTPSIGLNANIYNVFTHHPGVKSFLLWDDAINALKAIQK